MAEPTEGAAGSVPSDARMQMTHATPVVTGVTGGHLSKAHADVAAAAAAAAAARHLSKQKHSENESARRARLRDKFLELAALIDEDAAHYPHGGESGDEGHSGGTRRAPASADSRLQTLSSAIWIIKAHRERIDKLESKVQQLQMQTQQAMAQASAANAAAAAATAVSPHAVAGAALLPNHLHHLQQPHPSHLVGQGRLSMETLPTSHLHLPSSLSPLPQHSPLSVGHGVAAHARKRSSSGAQVWNMSEHAAALHMPHPGSPAVMDSALMHPTMLRESSAHTEGSHASVASNSSSASKRRRTYGGEGDAPMMHSPLSSSASSPHNRSGAHTPLQHHQPHASMLVSTAGATATSPRSAPVFPSLSSYPLLGLQASFFLGLDGALLDVSVPLLHLLGYARPGSSDVEEQAARKALLSQSLFTLLHPSELKATLAMMKTCLMQQQHGAAAAAGAASPQHSQDGADVPRGVEDTSKLFLRGAFAGLSPLPPPMMSPSSALSPSHSRSPSGSASAGVLPLRMLLFHVLHPTTRALSMLLGVVLPLPPADATAAAPGSSAASPTSPTFKTAPAGFPHGVAACLLEVARECSEMLETEQQRYLVAALYGTPKSKLNLSAGGGSSGSAASSAAPSAVSTPQGTVRSIMSPTSAYAHQQQIAAYYRGVMGQNVFHAPLQQPQNLRLSSSGAHHLEVPHAPASASVYHSAHARPTSPLSPVHMVHSRTEPDVHMLHQQQQQHMQQQRLQQQQQQQSHPLSASPASSAASSASTISASAAASSSRMYDSMSMIASGMAALSPHGATTAADAGGADSDELPPLFTSPPLAHVSSMQSSGGVSSGIGGGGGSDVGDSLFGDEEHGGDARSNLLPPFTPALIGTFSGISQSGGTPAAAALPLTPLTPGLFGNGAGGGQRNNLGLGREDEDSRMDG